MFITAKQYLSSYSGLRSCFNRSHGRACPAIYVFRWPGKKDVDARDKRGHDGVEVIRSHRNPL